jgi:RNA binding exosome subunit
VLFYDKKGHLGSFSLYRKGGLKAMRKFLSVCVVLGLVLAFICREAWADSAMIQNPDNGHYYQRIDSTMNWHAAKAYCKSVGGYLATITSEGEHNFVYDNLVSNSPLSWIGATDEAVEGTWEWVTGEPWDYTNWASGEPNNCSGIEHYLMYRASGFWNDLAGCNDRGCGCGGYGESYSMSTICEWDELAAEWLIDIDPDTLNKKSKGKWVTCEIVLPEGYNVNDIDISTVAITKVDNEKLASPIPAQISNDDNDNGNDNDHDHDDDDEGEDEEELKVKFDRQELIKILVPADSVNLTVSGELIDGTTRFEGSDTIRVIE